MKSKQPASEHGEMKLTRFGLAVVVLVVLAMAARFGTMHTGTGVGTEATLGSTSQTMGR